MQIQLRTLLGDEVADYLRFKSKRLTPASQRAYRDVLRLLAADFAERQLLEFEPPVGTQLVEEFLAVRWGHRAPRTYNRNLTVVRDFFVWQVKRGRLHGDPTLAIERAKPRAPRRTTFSADQRAAILAANPDPRYRLALRLLLDYGLRKGGLLSVRLESFDRPRGLLTVRTKGGKEHTVPIVGDDAWAELALVERAPGARQHHYLLPAQRVATRRRRAESLAETLQRRLADAAAAARALDAETGAATPLLDELRQAELALEQQPTSVEVIVWRDPERPMGEHGVHDWWYRCLARAGIVPDGVTRGARMHGARHSAGQRVLDVTGNLKAAQMLLGHASIATTGDHYTAWEIGRLGDTLRSVIPRSEVADRPG